MSPAALHKVRGLVEKTVRLCLCFTGTGDLHPVFVREVFRWNLVILQQQTFNFSELSRCVCGGIVPLEAQALHREAVAHHERQQTPINDIRHHCGIAFRYTLKNFKVHL